MCHKINVIRVFLLIENIVPLFLLLCWSCWHNLEVFRCYNIIMGLNTCTIVITKGKNSGKLCKDVNERCRHKSWQCKECGFHTFYKWSFEKHICNIKAPHLPEPDPELRPRPQHVIESKSESRSKSNSERPRLIKPPPPLRTQPQTYTYYYPVQPQPQPQTVINNYTINIQVVGDNLYNQLIQKMGKNGAINFLAGAAASNQPLNVLKKLYFDNVEPNSFPIATQDNNIRYLNNNQQLVQENATEFVSQLNEKIRDAMIYATNDLIRQSISTNNTDQLYEIYDISRIQHNITALSKIPLKDLQNVSSVPNHPFFAQEIVMLRVDS